MPLRIVLIGRWAKTLLTSKRARSFVSIARYRAKEAYVKGAKTKVSGKNKQDKHHLLLLLAFVADMKREAWSNILCANTNEPA
jgi:hypothetical protein